MSRSMTSFEETKNRKETGYVFKILSLATFVLAAVGFPWHDILVALARAGVPFPGHPPCG
jgi:hypothetical protein